MKITKNILFSGIFIFSLIVNVLVLFSVQNLYLRAILSFVYLITIPGILVMLMLRIRKISFWEYLVYTAGLSVAFLMFAGLTINWILPWLHITDKPLSLPPLIICFDIILLVFGFIAYTRNKEISLNIKLPKLDWLSWIFFITPVIFPILSIFGAITLNNGGSNYITMLMLGGVAAYVFSVVLLGKRLNENIYPWSILLISISLLLATSLRSWYISGPDVSIEYQMFQLTKDGSYWSISNAQNAYNACLSITILPTVFDTFIKVNDVYIFKFFFLIIFSLSPVGIFIIIKRFSSNVISFITVFFFMSYSSYLFNTPTHIKGAIALLFFTLMLLVLFNKSIGSFSKTVLFYIFSVSMIVSHYSTTYLALVIFIFTYVVSLIWERIEKWKPFSTRIKRLNTKENGRIVKNTKYNLTGNMVLVLIIATILWYTQLTETSGNIFDLTYKTVTNMGKIFSEDFKSEATSFGAQWNPFYKPKDQGPLLQDYVRQLESEFKNNPDIVHFSPETYKEYKPSIVNPEGVPLNTNLDIAAVVYAVGELIKRFVKIFMIFGIIIIILQHFKKREIDTDFIIMTFAGFFWLVAILILPFATVNYDLERAYQQILVVLSLPAVLGGLVVFKILRRKSQMNIILLCLVFIFYFLFYTGFIQQVFGGNIARLHLNNYGYDYERFYTQESEIESIEWLSENYNQESLMYADGDNRRKILAFSQYPFSVTSGVIPSIFDKNGYVYLGFSNILNERTFTFIEGRSLGYNFPTDFLFKNKNMIYNNGGSVIYK